MSEVTNIQYIKAKIKDFLGIDCIRHAVAVKWLIFNSNKYVSERSLIITSANGNVPQVQILGLIKNIYVVDNSLFCFEYQLYETLNLNRDLLAYEIAVPNLAQPTEFIDAVKLLDPMSYNPVSFKNSVYILTKYNLEDVIAHKTGN